MICERYAIASLGVWVVLNSLLGAASTWEDIVFGGLAAIIAVIGAITGK